MKAAQNKEEPHPQTDEDLSRKTERRLKKTSKGKQEERREEDVKDGVGRKHEQKQN